MLFLAGKYVQTPKLNGIARQISPMKKVMSQIMLYNWNTTQNRDVMNSTLNELDITLSKFMLCLDR